MKSYFIQAADVLFFKDGREIQAGSEYTAGSIFPPNPTTLYGAFRSAIISSVGQASFAADDFDLQGKIAEIVGTKFRTGSLAFKDFGLALRKADGAITKLYRMPQDVLSRKRHKTKEPRVGAHGALSVKPNEFGIRYNLTKAECSIEIPKGQEGDVFQFENAYLTEELFYDYLRNGQKDLTDATPGASIFTPEDLFVAEPRMGISLDYQTGTVAEGQLFTTPFIRPKNDATFSVGFHVLCENIGDTNVNGIIRIGGDGKLAILEEHDRIDPRIGEEISYSIRANKRFRLVLATPAPFDNGWIPDGIDPDTMRGRINGISVKLETAALGRYQIVGGWNLAKRMPKPSFRAVPSGSVYTFTLLEDDADLSDRLHQQSILRDEDLQKQGLGITYLGVV